MNFSQLFKYLMESSVCLIVFYLVYYLLLKNERYHTQKRIYILILCVLSAILPLLRVNLASLESGMITTISLPEVVLVNSSGYPGTGSFFQNWIILPVAVYFLGFLIRSGFTIFKLGSIWELILGSRKEKKGEYILVFNTNDPNPFSFMRYIFIGNRNYTKKEYRMILEHELVHVRQWHTLDILLMEFLSAVLWFNPVVYLYKKEIMEVHEHLADEPMINNVPEADNYLDLILSFLPSREYTIVNKLSYVRVKRRLSMFNKREQTFFSRLKPLFLLPFVLFSFLFFSCESGSDLNSKGQEEKAEEFNKQKALSVFDKMPSFDMAAMMKNIIYPEVAKKSGVEGKVVIKTLISKDGKVIDTEIVESVNKDLDNEAIRAIKETKFTPAVKDGNPAKAWVYIPVQFRLK